jgi:hypothetical protein
MTKISLYVLDTNFKVLKILDVSKHYYDTVTQKVYHRRLRKVLGFTEQQHIYLVREYGQCKAC